MFSLPEWAPHVHPLIVHFPLALLFTAVLVDLLALIFSRQVWLRWASSGLYALGALSALVAFYSGRDAAESVFLSASANSLLTDHANWAEWTVWFYGVYAVVRGFVEWRQIEPVRVVTVLLFVIGAGGLLLVKETGEHGAQLVYQHGVGVTSFAINIQPRDVESDPVGESVHGDSDSGGHTGAEAEGQHHDHNKGANVLTVAAGHEHMSPESGNESSTTSAGWEWAVGHQGSKAFKQQFRVIGGDWEGVQVGTDHDNAGRDVLTLQTNGVPKLWVAGQPIKDLQYDLRVNLTAFDGVIRLVHHVQDADDYNFMEISDSKITLGRLVDGALYIDDRGSIPIKGWVDLRVVSDGTHFRGYVNKKMVVHGHGPEPQSGPAGLYVRGTGLLMLNAFGVEKLR